MKIAPKTILLILKDVLGLAVYKKCTGIFLSDNLKKYRVIKSKQLLKRYPKEGHKKNFLRMRKFLQLTKILTNEMAVYAESSNEASQ